MWECVLSVIKKGDLENNWMHRARWRLRCETRSFCTQMNIDDEQFLQYLYFNFLMLLFVSVLTILQILYYIVNLKILYLL